MDVPLVISLNYADIARKKHLHTDNELLGNIFQARVIETIAIKGIGVHELVDAALTTIMAVCVVVILIDMLRRWLAVYHGTAAPVADLAPAPVRKGAPPDRCC